MSNEELTKDPADPDDRFDDLARELADCLGAELHLSGEFATQHAEERLPAHLRGWATEHLRDCVQCEELVSTIRRNWCGEAGERRIRRFAKRLRAPFRLEPMPIGIRAAAARETLERDLLVWTSRGVVGCHVVEKSPNGDLVLSLSTREDALRDRSLRLGVPGIERVVVLRAVDRDQWGASIRLTRQDREHFAEDALLEAPYFVLVDE